LGSGQHHAAVQRRGGHSSGQGQAGVRALLDKLATTTAAAVLRRHLFASHGNAVARGRRADVLVLLKDGYISFKVFMPYDELVLNDCQLLDVFDVARNEGALVMVHAEGYDAIRFMTERLERAGKTTPYYHAASRPEIVEREATHRAISHAELVDVPIMIVHVSGREAMEQIRWAQSRGLKVYAETCPQYITLTADDLQGLDMDVTGAKYVCSPPPRDSASQDAIWDGLRSGVFQTSSSDHCPFRYDSPAGKMHPKGRTSFRWVPNGIPGVETRLPILSSEGVPKGRISVNRFVELTSTNHAKLYGLYPRKGSIGGGFDADITLWDPNRQRVIRQEILDHGADYTPWEGFAVTGWPVMTLVRGRVVAEEGRIVGEKGLGRILDREISAYASRPVGNTGCRKGSCFLAGRCRLLARPLGRGEDITWPRRLETKPDA
jgi:dihydropyrimidinase